MTLKVVLHYECASRYDALYPLAHSLFLIVYDFCFVIISLSFFKVIFQLLITKISFKEKVGENILFDVGCVQSQLVFAIGIFVTLYSIACTILILHLFFKNCYVSFYY